MFSVNDPFDHIVKSDDGKFFELTIKFEIDDDPDCPEAITFKALFWGRDVWQILDMGIQDDIKYQAKRRISDYCDSMADDNDYAPIDIDKFTKKGE